MRILFIGDIVGRSGRTILLNHMPKLIAEWSLDLVVVNGENAAGGFGITESIYNDFIDAGADAITLGTHAWISARRWCSSSARRGSFVRSTFRRAPRGAAPP